MNSLDRRFCGGRAAVRPTLWRRLCPPLDDMSEALSGPSSIMLDRSRALVPDAKALPAWTSPRFPADSGRDDKSKV